MMIKRQSRNLETAGFLVICFVLLALAAKRYETSFPARSGDVYEEAIVVQIRGEVPFKGTYVFERPPVMGELFPDYVKITSGQDARAQGVPLVRSHSLLEVEKHNGEWAISRREIPAYQKLTLGIPLSLNRESEEGLTAIPGIGPQTAKLLIVERRKRGGFKSIHELKSIRGIGNGTFQKIKPFLTL